MEACLCHRIKKNWNGNCNFFPQLLVYMLQFWLLTCKNLTAKIKLNCEVQFRIARYILTIAKKKKGGGYKYTKNTILDNSELHLHLADAFIQIQMSNWNSEKKMNYETNSELWNVSLEFWENKNELWDINPELWDVNLEFWENKNELWDINPE